MPGKKPTKTKKLEGNRSRVDLPVNELDPGGTPRCPEWLEECGREVWHEIVGGMPEGFLCRVDSQLLAQYCHAWEIFMLAREAVIVNGTTATSANGALVANPDTRTMFSASEQIRKLSGHFGLSPRDRVGLEWVVDKPVADKFGIVG